MATLHLVTGYQGTPHITSADQGLFNAGCFGLDEYVLGIGKRFEAQIISNNVVRIQDGTLLMQGRQINLENDTFLDANISNGTQSQYRNDLIVMRYVKDQSSGIESAVIAVIQGTPTSGTPTDPTYNTDSILDNATIHDMPLYRVKLSGLTIESIEPMFTVLAPLADLQHGFYKQNMLINGDFQCNQRGEKTYDITTTVAYTVDMWRAYQVRVNVLNEGVELTGKSATTQGYFTQFIQLGKLKTTTYTISAMVDDKICTFTLTPGGTAKEKVFEKFKISALTTSTWDDDLGDYNNKLKLNICPVGTSTFKVTYIDVFEGDIVYPHVKEDYGTALMRCQMYIRKKGYSTPLVRSRYEDASALEGSSVISWFNIVVDTMANIFNAKINPPQIEKISWNFYYSTEGQSGTTAFGTVQGTITDVTAIKNASGVELIGLKKTDVTLSSVVREPSNPAVYGSYVVTCEPRDA